MIELYTLLAEAVALVGGTVHTMDSAETEPQVATVLIRGRRIEAIGPDVEVPAGAVRYDVSGMHVVPGLIDGMMHFDREHDALYLASGVTTVRDLGGVRVNSLLERSLERRDRTPGPNVVSPGALLDGDPPASAEAVVLRDVKGVEGFLPVLFQDDVDFLSIHLGLGADVLREVIARAHDQDLQVWGPVPRSVTLAEAVAAGQDGIVYLDRLLPTVEGVDWTNVQPAALKPAIALLAEGDVGVVPVLQASALRLYDQSDRVDLLALLSFSYENWWLGELQTRLSMREELDLEIGQRVVEKQRALVRALFEAGVPLVPGSGSPHPWLLPGQALHQELGQWIEAGFTPYEVLRLATRGAAEALELEDEVGSLVPGLLADVVCVEQDPREDLSGLVAPEIVVIRGRVLERRDLEDLLASVAARNEKERRALEQPLEVAPPPTPEGALVLEGLVETRAVRQRLSSERFRVVRLPDGGVLYAGRVVFPDPEGEPRRELLVEQRTRGGELESYRLTMLRGEDELVAEGMWEAGRMRMERRVNGAFVDNQSSPQRPACVDVQSATSLLVLGQRALDRPFPILTFHEGLAPEYANWSLELDDKGQHQVRTHTGRMAFRFTEHGAPELWHVAVGQGVIETVLLQEDALGGGGHPLPATKRAAQAPAAGAPAEAGATPPPPDEEPPPREEGAGGGER